MRSQYTNLVEQCLARVAPQQLAPYPSASIAEFAVAGLVDAVTLAKETELGGCFRPIVDTLLRPIVVSQIQQSQVGFDQIKLTLELSNVSQVAWRALSMQRLSLFFSGEFSQAIVWWWLFLKHCQCLQVIGDNGQSTSFPGQESVVPGYVGDEETICPSIKGCLNPWEGVRDYFHFPEKYLFVELRGLDKPLADVKQKTILLVFMLSRHPCLNTLTDTSIRVNCCPVVNITHAIAEPILVDQQHTHYPLVIDGQGDSQPLLYDIVSVTSINHLDEEQTVWVDALSCLSSPSFQLTRKRTASFAYEYYVSLSGESAFDRQTLSCELLVCAAESISRDHRLMASGAGFTQEATLLCTPSQVRLPDDEKLPPWLWFSQQSLLTPEPLQHWLRQQCWGHCQKTQGHMAAIQAIHADYGQGFYHGAYYHQWIVTLEIVEQAFSSIAECYLFASVLSQGLTQLAMVNTRVLVDVVLFPTKTRWQWQYPGRQVMV